MKITFILPNTTDRAIGGYKIVYQYANYLAEHRHDVTIIYDDEQMIMGHSAVVRPAIKLRSQYFLKIEPRWFNLNDKIKKVRVSKLDGRKILDSDVVVATAKITADYIFRENVEPKKVIYLIQDFENWGCDDDEVYKTYQYGYTNTAISKRLVKLVEQNSTSECIHMPDGIDTDNFKCITPVTKRREHSLAMMYRNSPRKGWPDGLAVLKKLKQKYPDLVAVVFGVDKKPIDMPGWIEYIYRADQKILAEIYNRVRVFLSTSLQEGYGLTGLESMACGCALVSTDTLGVHEYAVNEQSASIVPIGSVEELAKSVEELFANEKLLTQRSMNGLLIAEQFGLGVTGKRFEELAIEQLKKQGNAKL